MEAEPPPASVPLLISMMAKSFKAQSRTSVFKAAPAPEPEAQKEPDPARRLKPGQSVRFRDGLTVQTELEVLAARCSGHAAQSQPCLHGEQFAPPLLLLPCQHFDTGCNADCLLSDLTLCLAGSPPPPWHRLLSSATDRLQQTSGGHSGVAAQLCMDAAHIPSAWLTAQTDAACLQQGLTDAQLLLLMSPDPFWRIRDPTVQRNTGYRRTESMPRAAPMFDPQLKRADSLPEMDLAEEAPAANADSRWACLVWPPEAGVLAYMHASAPVQRVACGACQGSACSRAPPYPGSAV